MRTQISNADDVLDSRDVVARIEELTEKRDAAAAVTLDVEAGVYRDEDGKALSESEAEAKELLFDDGEREELAALLALQEEASSSPDWSYGETLIADSYFRDYAEQLAEDIGAVDPKASWPVRCIDWDAAAEELKQDYFQVDFGGVTYWIRG